jgi:acyl carrier protein
VDVDKTIEQLKQMLAEDLNLPIPLEQIDPDAPLLDGGLNLDSLAIVDLITLTERDFGVHFGEDDLTMDVFASLRTLATAIVAHRGPA